MKTHAEHRAKAHMPIDHKFHDHLDAALVCLAHSPSQARFLGLAGDTVPPKKLVYSGYLFAPVIPPEAEIECTLRGDDNDCWLVSEQIDAGYSGSGVRIGELLVGIALGRHRKAHVGYVLPIGDIRPWLDEVLRSRPESPGPPGPPDPPFQWSFKAAIAALTLALAVLLYMLWPNTLDVLLDGKLTPGFDMSVNSDGGKTDWVAKESEVLRLAFPPDQNWSTLFITNGKLPELGARKGRDLAKYKTLLLDLKGEKGTERVSVGIKSSSQPDDRSAARVELVLTAAWATYQIPLEKFLGDKLKDLGDVHVVAELVSTDRGQQVVYCKNVKYSTKSIAREDEKQPAKLPEPKEIEDWIRVHESYAGQQIDNIQLADPSSVGNHFQVEADVSQRDTSGRLSVDRVILTFQADRGGWRLVTLRRK